MAFAELDEKCGQGEESGACEESLNQRTAARPCCSSNESCCSGEDSEEGQDTCLIQQGRGIGFGRCRRQQIGTKRSGGPEKAEQQESANWHRIDSWWAQAVSSVIDQNTALK